MWHNVKTKNDVFVACLQSCVLTYSLISIIMNLIKHPDDMSITAVIIIVTFIAVGIWEVDKTCYKKETK